MLTMPRRRFLTTVALGGGAAAILSPRFAHAADPPPETTSVRIGKYPVICYGPQYVSEELLRAEGFTDISFPDGQVLDAMTVSHELGQGKFDFAVCFGSHFVVGIDRGEPILVVSGVHAGCFELIAREGVRGITDLKGKTVGTNVTPELMMALAYYVGLDPYKDLNLVVGYNPTGYDMQWGFPKHMDKPLEQFVQGKIDAFLGVPPEPQELHARGNHNVILRTAVDEPWSQYYCCMMAVNREYLEKHPVATKRVIRALLKANDVCARNPEWSARQLVARGFADNYDYALQTFKENRYDNWRELDATDSMRFYALRLYELGMIKKNPRRIAEVGTDPRFLNQLKRELKV